MESLSSYARMFLGQMDKPDVDYIEGLSPAISIDQKTTSKNPRSTVGTVTEIYDYLRLLWARAGTPHCPNCGREIRQQTIDQIIDQVLALPEGTRIQVLAPVIRGKKGEHAKVFEDAKRSGYVRARVDGSLYELDEEIKLEKNKKHSIEIIVDRLVIRPDIRQRLTDSVETAAKLSGGLIVVNLLREERDLSFSQNYACEVCGISMEELTPRMFSFNNPFGACPTCTGLGSQLKADPALIVPEGGKSILDGAIQASGWNNIRGDGISRMYFEALSKKYHFSLTDPWDTLSEEVRNIVLYGTGGEQLELHYDQPRGKGVLRQAFEGICTNIERRFRETQSDASRRELEELMSECPCPDCRGRRLRKESLAVTVGDRNIYDFTTLSVSDELTMAGRPAPDRAADADCRPDSQGDPLPAGLFTVRGAGVSDPCPQRRHPLRRREPENPSGYADWLQPDGRAVYSGRALHRIAPAGQRQAPGHALQASGIWATASLWWSMTRTPCGRRIISSTSAPAPAPTAAGWWRPVHRKR